MKQFFDKHWRKLTALLVWLLIIGGYWGYAHQQNLMPLDVAQQLSRFLQDSIYGPFFFLLIFVVRPIIFFPTAILVLLAGFLFGPLWGVVYAMGGNLVSAQVGYLLGRYFGGEIASGSGEKNSILKKYSRYLRQNSFEGVLVLRLLLLHFDTVSYLSGFLKLKVNDFLLATALGSVAGVVSYVLAGASFEGQFNGVWPAIDPWMLAAGGVLFVISLAIAWGVRYRTNTAAKASGTPPG